MLLQSPRLWPGLLSTGLRFLARLWLLLLSGCTVVSSCFFASGEVRLDKRKLEVIGGCNRAIEDGSAALQKTKNSKEAHAC